MSNESIFTDEYKIDNTTEAKSKVGDANSITQDNEVSKLREEIEKDYKLSKPRRKIIRARVIPE